MAKREASRPRAVSYGRVSLDVEDSVSKPRQQREIRDYLERHDYDLVGEFFDPGVRATKVAPSRRPAWQQVEQAVERGGISLVIVWSLDRLIRSSDDWRDVKKWSEQAGVKIATVHGLLNLDDPMGEFTATIMAAVGQLEAQQIGARAKSARREMVLQKNRQPGGRRPWPFALAPAPTGEGHVLRPIPERAEAIRWACSYILDGGTMKAVCDEFTRRGLYRDDNEGHWYISPLRRLLSNPAMIGGKVYAGEPVRNADGSIRVDPDQAILDEQDWHRLVSVMTARNKPGRPTVAPSLLARLLVCESCARATADDQKGRATYLHYHRGKDSYRCGWQPCPKPVSIRRELVEEIYVERWLGTFGAATQEPDDQTATVDPADLKPLTEALDGIRSELSDDNNPPSDERGLELLRLQRDLRQQLKDLRSELESKPAGHLLADGRWVEAWTDRRGETWGDRYRRADGVVEQNAVLLDLGAVVYVKPGKQGGSGHDPLDRLDFRGW